MQLQFMRDIDTDKTKKAVEKALARYRFLLLRDKPLPTQRMTANYSDMPRSGDTRFRSETESIALATIEMNEEAVFKSSIEQAVAKLQKNERIIIEKQYMDPENPQAKELYDECFMSKSAYYRWREKAFYKLAFAIHIEVYK